jgi:putative endonuclease
MQNYNQMCCLRAGIICNFALVGKRETGLAGESYALQWLQMQGYEILELNWRYRRLELDIIARIQNRLIFVEVKTRSREEFSFPEISVDYRKQKFMMAAAAAYMKEMQNEGPFRFDIIAVVIRPHMRKLIHIRDAFFPNSAA